MGRRITNAECCCEPCWACCDDSAMSLTIGGVVGADPCGCNDWNKQYTCNGHNKCGEVVVTLSCIQPLPPGSPKKVSSVLVELIQGGVTIASFQKNFTPAVQACSALGSIPRVSSAVNGCDGSAATCDFP